MRKNLFVYDKSFLTYGLAQSTECIAFSLVVGIGTPPPPSSAGECASPLFWFRWRGTLAGEGVGPQFRRGYTVYMYFVLLSKNIPIPNLPLFILTMYTFSVGLVTASSSILTATTRVFSIIRTTSTTLMASKLIWL